MITIMSGGRRLCKHGNERRFASETWHEDDCPLAASCHCFRRRSSRRSKSGATMPYVAMPRILVPPSHPAMMQRHGGSTMGAKAAPIRVDFRSLHSGLQFAGDRLIDPLGERIQHLAAHLCILAAGPGRHMKRMIRVLEQRQGGALAECLA